VISLTKLRLHLDRTRFWMVLSAYLSVLFMASYTFAKFPFPKRVPIS